MTTATRTDPGKLTAARAAFVAFFGLALGWAGVVVAAVAVAAERARNGDAVVDRPASAPGSAGWWQNHRLKVAERRAAAAERAWDWLQRDRDRRRQLTEQRQAWIRDGADPATEPAKPGYFARLAGLTRRSWHRSQLANDKLVRGWDRAKHDLADGWRAAAPYAPQGFTAAAKARPHDPRPDTGEPVDAEIVDEHPGNTEMRPEPPAPDAEPATDPGAETETKPEPAPAGPESGTTTGTGDDTDMTIPTMDTVTANPNPQAVDGEDHLDRIAAGLGQMGGTLNRADEATDLLAAEAARLRAEAQATMERAGDKATTATRQACDEALALAGRIEALVTQVSEASAACAESVGAADQGLNPGRNARDELHSAGASGELLAHARDAAA